MMSDSKEAVQILRQHVQFLRDHQGVRHLKLSQAARAGLNKLAAANQPPAKTALVSERRVEKPSAPRIAKPAPLAPISERMPIEGSAKIEQLRHLAERASVCTKCPHLAARRTNVVFGVGHPDAELMFVGEAPGEEEDLQGEPFVGRAGQLLTKMILAMGLTREQIYIANIVKCRPDMPPGAPGNRKPTRQEMATCLPFLHAQIDVIKPKVLVALGATAVEGLLGAAGPIGSLRGTFQDYHSLPVMPTFHPSYLLRNQSNTEKRKVWEDLLKVMERLGLPISEKQQNFFLTTGK